VTAIAATAVIGTRDTGSESEPSGGPEASSELNDDPSDSGDVSPTDRRDQHDATDDDRNRERADHDQVDRDRDRDRLSSDDTEGSPTASDQGSDEGDDPTTEPTQTEPTETSEPTDEPTESEPTEPTEPTDEPDRPLADLGVGPEIEKHDFLGLLWNEVTIPASGVQKVDSATMVVTVENMVSWSDSNGDGEVADWSCDQVDSETIQCSLGDVEQAGEPQDLGMSLFTSGTSSEVTASISASDYRDPKPSNNSVSTHVVL
jgi:hypothetical protein